MADRIGSTGASTYGRSPRPTDVIVVGAGPTGLMLAGDLAAAGVAVTVLERRPHETSNLTRAFGVHARTLELLDSRGLADELVARGQPVDGLRLFKRLTLDMSRLRSRFPFVLITPQYEVERLLERRAVDAGVHFRYGTEVRGIRQDADGVEVEVRGHRRGDGDGDGDGDGENGGGDGGLGTGVERLRAAYVVGADGVRSAVRTALGLPFPGRSVISSIILADVRLAEKPEGLLTVSGVGQAFAFIAPFGDGWYRVMGWNRAHQVPDSAPLELDEVKNLARLALGSDFGMHDARWLSRFHSEERQVPSYREGRVLLAGDAAHVHSPPGAQGLNTGLQDAANLGWKLAAVLRGHASADLLDTYQTERHPVGASVVRSSGAILRLAMARTPAERALRAAIAWFLNSVRPAGDKAMGQVSGIGIAYGRGHGAHRLTGRRAPDLTLAASTCDGLKNAPVRLHEALRAGKFVLVGPPGEFTDTGSRDDRLTVASWPGTRSPARPTAVLVRPDGYVAWATDDRDPSRRAEALEAALIRWAGPESAARSASPVR
ncbi:FAD-dependent monooxygenase [Streptomyces sp. NPDC047108]|uniref:FAD-dependent monooxygenase n=1 Tax=Streptomyces sp. NPDC047108 TaxID=3155025 RepID=UPI0033D997D2